jgi:hypothetical protein
MGLDLDKRKQGLDLKKSLQCKQLLRLYFLLQSQ